MKKKNIIIFHPYPKFGGADRSIIKLINGLKNSNVFFLSITECKYKKYLTKKNICFIKLKYKRVLLNFFQLKKIISKIIFNSNKKNIFVSNQNFANIVSVIALKKIKNLKIILIERNHLNELRNFKNIKDFVKKKIILYLIKIFYKRSDAIVGISKSLSYDLRKYINKKVFTIYNPALDKDLYKDTLKKINFKKNPKRFNILNVGFLEPQKDHFTLLKAFKIVSKFNLNVYLLIVGKGSLLKKLKILVKKMKIENRVKFYTNIKNPENFYKFCDLFVLTSLYEGFGNVVVESLKFKCPVIVSNCKSGPSEIINYGQYGEIFKMKDHQDLAKKICKHIKYPNKLILKTRDASNHLKKFSFKNNSKEFDKLFNNI